MIDSRDNRAFHYAVLASLALHALLFFSFPDLLNPARRAARFPPPIVARLLEPEPVAAPAAPPVQPADEEKMPRTKPAVPRAVEPVPSLAPSPAQPTQAPAEPAPVVEAPAASGPAPSSIAAIEPQPAARPQAGESPESLSQDQYRLQLIDEARRRKRYPPLARENNWQGEVLVAVLIGASGRASVTLKRGSGYEVLDRQALEMFRQAARAVPVPPALRGKEFALEVRARYGLED